jgi:glycosyltransferase involved in cell wall biosynthesis
MEGLAVPSKTYSYLAAGRPVAAVISPNTDIARELMEYGAGAVFRNGDAEGLARWLAALAGDRDRVVKMGANARRLFEERYRRETCTGRYAALIGDILRAERKGT